MYRFPIQQDIISAFSAVDEGEERTRWVPWVLLALLIIIVGISTFFIVQTIKKDPDTPKQNNSNRRAFDGKEEQFDGCGTNGLMGRLRYTAKQTTINHFGVIQSQWDRADTVWVNISSISLSGTSTNGYAVCFFLNASRVVLHSLCS